MEVKTEADVPLPALPPPVACVKKPKALVANVRYHYQPTCEEIARKLCKRHKEGYVAHLEGHLENSRSTSPWLQRNKQ